MRFPFLLVVSLLAAIVGSLVPPALAQDAPPPLHTFTIGQEEFLLDGKPFVIRSGEMHFPRVPREYWEHRLRMAHSMGLNAVCVPLFWNYHEMEEGSFDWKNQKDAAEFCRLAQKEGLWVILRPGPYAGAEWEMGGLPWWLLKSNDGPPQRRLRTNNPRFMAAAAHYFKEVGRVLAPLQVTRGGPILMVQVENEYGSLGKDAAYMGGLRQATLDAGFDVPLFACNPPEDLANGYRDDLFQAVNFGSDPEVAFHALRKYQKTGPLMSGEFYSGWHDTWGRAHHVSDTRRSLVDLKYMLDHRSSFSIHMAHGGTTFGLWSGSDRPFRPDTSSYDHDAPISEAGWATDKFTKTRELLARYLQPGETMPEPLAANPVVEVAPFAFERTAELTSAGGQGVYPSDDPESFEVSKYGRGCNRNDGQLPAGPAGTLTVGEVHDFAWVYLNGELCPGVLDRRSKQYSVWVPERKETTYITIMVEAAGRVDSGQEAADMKGIHYGVSFAPSDGGKPVWVKHWLTLPIPLHDEDVAQISRPKPHGADGKPHLPQDEAGFWYGTFTMEKPGDTFLDLRGWGKGVVWVNEHCLGRYWNIGPTQTMYLPGPWMKAGKNEVVVLDMERPRNPSMASMAGLKQPILNELHPELDFARQTRAAGTFSAEGATLAAAGSFTPAVEWQDIKFERPIEGRYFCLEARNAFDSQSNFAAIAELDAVGVDGKSLIKDWWKVLWVSSEETEAEPGEAENALDGRSITHWHTRYQPEPASFPHRFVVDMGESLKLSGIRYLPRAGDAVQPGRIKDYRVYVSDKPFGLTATP